MCKASGTVGALSMETVAHSGGQSGCFGEQAGTERGCLSRGGRRDSSGTGKTPSLPPIHLLCGGGDLLGDKSRGPSLGHLQRMVL